MVRAIRREGVEDVGDGNDTGETGDLFSLFLFRVPRAVVVLVVLIDDVFRFLGNRGDVFYRFFSVNGVSLDLFPFFWSQGRFLIDDVPIEFLFPMSWSNPPMPASMRDCLSSP